MSDLTSDADRLRIAIALTALKFKPTNQSCAAYVLQLRSVFPPSTPAAPTADGSWKTHALALEQDLARLKEQYEAEQIKTILTPPAPLTDSTPSGSQPPKRKPKKKPSDKHPEVPARADLETVLEDLNGRPDFVALPSSDSLFSSFSAFQRLTSALTSSPTAVTATQRSLLLSTTTRALTALANVLHPLLHSTEITVSSQAVTLQTLTILAHHLVASSLNFLLRKPKKNATQPATVSSLLNKLLDALITQIFRPILESFSPFTHRYLTFLFLPTPLAVLPVDLRPDLLHLFHSVFSPLIFAPSGYEVNLRGTLALVALRELENLLPPWQPDDVPQPRTHDSRVNALVRKDALWYQCTILHLLFAPPNDRSMLGSTVGAVSERGIIDALSRIVSRCRAYPNDVEGVKASSDNEEISGRDSSVDDGPSEGPPNNLDLEVIDEVGYGMILGVIERYWLWTEGIRDEQTIF
ncbi:hypothetical protein C8R44DRAFT_867597 [Mycena epipterygia]|nr:hypothetical protein C8R44DRAFT_867597 [Mycena epipterygia]